MYPWESTWQKLSVGIRDDLAPKIYKIDIWSISLTFNTLKPRQKWATFRRRHFQMFLLEWRYMSFGWYSTEICSWGQINNISTMVQIMAWCRPTTSHNQRQLTHWSRVTHMCASKLTIIIPDNGLAPGRRQTIIWTNAGILLIRNLGTHFNEILGEIHTSKLTKIYLNMSYAKRL